mmetsp:Transcript_97303/g.275300  ORF Transcript_97303/g.275300 Transcript_97303/m.275300 type:complete len:276 (-) Transcript_97303:15-842(-)
MGCTTLCAALLLAANRDALGVSSLSRATLESRSLRSAMIAIVRRLCASVPRLEGFRPFDPGRSAASSSPSSARGCRRSVASRTSFDPTDCPPHHSSSEASSSEPWASPESMENFRTCEARTFEPLPFGDFDDSALFALNASLARFFRCSAMPSLLACSRSSTMMRVCLALSFTDSRTSAVFLLSRGTSSSSSSSGVTSGPAASETDRAALVCSWAGASASPPSFAEAGAAAPGAASASLPAIWGPRGPAGARPAGLTPLAQQPCPRPHSPRETRW